MQEEHGKYNHPGEEFAGEEPRSFGLIFKREEGGRGQCCS